MFINVKSSPYDAVGNGTTDDRAAFVSADAAGGTLYVPRGTYRIGPGSPAAPLTLTSDIRFEQGAVLKPDSNVTIELDGSLDAGVFRVFDVSAADSKVLPNRVERYVVTWWGAMGDGSDDTAEIQAALDAIEFSGGVMLFPRGDYRITSAIVVEATAGSFSGVTLQGDGIGNGGGYATSLIYDGTGAFALALQAADDLTGLYNFTLRDLSVRATDPGFTGNLVKVVGVGLCRFENCLFAGPADPEAPTVPPASALVYGNFWVDFHLIRCQFVNAKTGLEKAFVENFTDSVTNVSVQQCRFNDCDTSIDIQGNVQGVWVLNSTFERALDISSSTLVLTGNPPGGVVGCWFGDGNGNDPWIQVGGLAPSVVGNFIAQGSVGIHVLSGTFAPRVEGNHVYDADEAAILCESSSSASVANNFLYLRDGSTGVRITADPRAAVVGNVIWGINGGGPTTDTVGLRFETSTGGEYRGNSFDVETQISSAASLAAWNNPTLNGATIDGPLVFSGTATNPPSTSRWIGNSGTLEFLVYNALNSGGHVFTENGQVRFRLAETSAATNDTIASIAYYDGSGWVGPSRVSVGAANSGGAGFRMLRIPN